MTPTRTVEIVDHDPGWPALFSDLARVLGNALGDLSLSIEHVGSTAIPNLAAKPVIDLDVVIGVCPELPEVIRALADYGYIHQGDLGITGREAFHRAGEDVPRDGSGRTWPSHHLYVCARDSEELKRHLAFRDYLREHPDARRDYETLKRRLARAFRHDIDGYVAGKAAFVEDILRRSRSP